MELIIYVVGMCVAFLLGAYVRGGKETEIKVIKNPIQTIKDNKMIKQLEKEQEKEQEIYKTIAENIDRYDGTSNGQQDIPR